MKLAEALHRMSFQSLLNMADYDSLGSQRIRSKTVVAGLIRKKLLAPEPLSEWIQNMTEKDFFICYILINFFQEAPARLESLKTFIHKCFPQRGDSFLSRILELGIFLSIRLKAGGEEKAVPIKETFDTFQRFAKPRFHALFFEPGKFSGISEDNSPYNILRDFYALMFFFSRETLKLSLMGVFYQMDLKRLQVRLPHYADRLEGLNANIGSHDNSNSILHVFIQFALENKICKIMHSEFTFSHDIFHSFLKEDSQKQLLMIFEFWFKARLGQPSTRWLIYRFISMLDSTRVYLLGFLLEWGILNNDFFQELCRWDFIRCTTASSLHDQFLLKRSAMADYIFSGKSLPQPPFRTSFDLVVQPNFEILVDKNIPVLDLEKIECFANPVRVDQLMIYRIDDSSLLRSFQRGMNTDKINSYLSSCSRKEIPRNVLETSRDHEKRFDEILLTRTVLLEVRRHELIPEIRKLSSMHPVISREIGEGFFLVAEESLKDVLELLDENSYHARMIESPGKSMPDPAPFFLWSFPPISGFHAPVLDGF